MPPSKTAKRTRDETDLPKNTPDNDEPVDAPPSDALVPAAPAPEAAQTKMFDMLFVTPGKSAPGAPAVVFKTKSSNVSGGLDTSGRFVGTVTQSGFKETPHGKKPTLSIHLTPGNFGKGIANIAGKYLGYQVPVIKRSQDDSAPSVRAPSLFFFDEKPRLMSIGNAIVTTSFFPNNADAAKGPSPDPPPPGSVAAVLSPSCTAGAKGGDRLFPNGKDFQVLSIDDKPAFEHLSNAIRKLDASESAHAAACMSMSLSCGGFGVPDLSEGQEAQRKTLEQMAVAEFAKMAESTLSSIAAQQLLIDNDTSKADHSLTATLATLQMWRNEFSSLASTPEPLAFLAKHPNHMLFTNTDGFPVTMAITGATPAAPYSSALAKIRGGDGLPETPLASLGVLGFWLSDKSALLRIALKPIALPAPAEYEKALKSSGDYSLLQSSAATLGFKVAKDSIPHVSSVIWREQLFWGELVKYQEAIVSFPVMPSPAASKDSFGNELDVPWGSHYVLDVPSTLAKAPQATVDEVRTLLGEIIIAPPFIAKSVTSEFCSVGAGMFGERFFVPLQESGVSLKDLDTEAAALGGVVKFALLFSGAVEKAWAIGGTSPAPALPLLEAAAEDAKMTPVDFLTQNGTMYAYMAKA